MVDCDGSIDSIRQEPWTSPQGALFDISKREGGLVGGKEVHPRDKSPSLIEHAMVAVYQLAGRMVHYLSF